MPCSTEASPYPVPSGEPRLPEGTIGAVGVWPRPMSDAAVSLTDRIFSTIHPESNPKLCEWVAGMPVTWPPKADRSKVFATPLGIRADGPNRLSAIPHIILKDTTLRTPCHPALSSTSIMIRSRPARTWLGNVLADDGLGSIRAD
jgi:hypothetical protein